MNSPRSQKFLIWDHIQATALSVLEALIEATRTRGRDRLLVQADLGVEKRRSSPSSSTASLPTASPTA